jgi:hypothetical protein
MWPRQIEETFEATDAADYLEKVVRAIRERRLRTRPWVRLIA